MTGSMDDQHRTADMHRKDSSAISMLLVYYIIYVYILQLRPSLENFMKSLKEDVDISQIPLAL